MMMNKLSYWRLQVKVKISCILWQWCIKQVSEGQCCRKGCTAAGAICYSGQFSRVPGSPEHHKWTKRWCSWCISFVHDESGCQSGVTRKGSSQCMSLADVKKKTEWRWPNIVNPVRKIPLSNTYCYMINRLVHAWLTIKLLLLLLY